MFKTPIIISLVMLAVICAVLSQGLIAAAFSLLAFTLLFYVESKEKTKKDKEHHF